MGQAGRGLLPRGDRSTCGAGGQLNWWSRGPGAAQMLEETPELSPCCSVVLIDCAQRYTTNNWPANPPG